MPSHGARDMVDNMTDFDSRRQETAAVKKALREAGINARVSHGRGTAYGWLRVNIGEGQDFPHAPECRGDEPGHACVSGCPRRENMQAIRREAKRTVQDVTGRSGDKVTVLTQDHWDQKKGESVPIPQPDWERVDPHAPDKATNRDLPGA